MSTAAAATGSPGPATHVRAGDLAAEAKPVSTRAGPSRGLIARLAYTCRWQRLASSQDADGDQPPEPGELLAPGSALVRALAPVACVSHRRADRRLPTAECALRYPTKGIST
jgi:hypothetical protein